MRLGDVIYINPESIRSGYPYKEIEYIDISSVGTGILNGTTLIKIEDAPSRAKRIVKSGDTLLATVRPNLRSFLFIKNPPSNTIASTGFAVLRATKKIDPRFLYYTVTNQSFTDYLSANVKGAAYPAIDTETIHRADVYLPDITIQHRIASILSAYDDLIENNTRRIAILEEMARRIYEEWFVHFRFPGHEKVKMVDSELGKIPEGWEVKKLSDVLTTLESGTRPKGGIDPNERGVPSIGAENINGLGQYDYNKEKFVSRDFFDSMRRGKIKSGDVLLYKDGAHIGRKTLFRDNFPHKECAINEHVFILRADENISQSYLYFWLDQHEMTSKIKSLNANAAQPGINQVGVNGLPILVPRKEMIYEFNVVIEPLLGLLFSLAKKNSVLSTTRDFLLPKLISGEIDVSKLPDPEDATV